MGDILHFTFSMRVFVARVPINFSSSKGGVRGNEKS